MSSFRPDVDRPTPAFAPMAFARAGAGLFAPTRPASPESQKPSESSAEPEPTPRYSAEELAEREQAAFDRGAASAVTEAAQVEAAFRALEKAGQSLRLAAASEPSINREQMVELCALIASRWVAAELHYDVSHFAGIVERAFEAAGAFPSARLCLHPEDHARLLGRESERLARWSTQRNVELASDETLARSEFRIEMPRSIVDGRFASIRQRLEEALDEALAAEPPALPSEPSALESEPSALPSKPSAPESEPSALKSEETE